MYRFCRIGNTNLICYRNGTILRFHKKFKKWTVIKGCNNRGHLSTEINGKQYKMHRIIAVAFKILDDINSPLEIDHINRVRNDNSVSNLRAVTKLQNSFNQIGKGYNFISERNKWMARIGINNKVKNLGYFDTKEEAKNAYLDAKKIYHII
jgi:hypothetical protein